MSPRRSEDYTRCPSCGRRTVLLMFGRGGEDYYRCTRGACAWETFAEPEGWDRQGRADLQAWKALNEPTQAGGGQ